MTLQTKTHLNHSNHMNQLMDDDISLINQTVRALQRLRILDF